MRLKFKTLKQVEKQIVFDTDKLKDTNTRFRYQLEVPNRFKSLEETDDIQLRLSNFKMLYVLLQTQLLVGNEVPAKSSGYRMNNEH